MLRLRRVDCTRPGLSRRRHGRGFTYHDMNGARISDPVVIERIQALVIPPAWRDVWICPHPRGHIQAVGTDAAGRRQYRYHDVWRQQQDAAKFDRLLDIAEGLPETRRRVAEHLAQPGLPREKVLACAVRLLELGFFRVGSERYAERNQTFGLATIKRQHVTISRVDVATFDYIAKGGKHRVQSVVDPDVAKILRSLKRRQAGGDDLLAYQCGSRWYDVTSDDINDYLREVTGREVSAKDFRTWNATVLAAVGLAVSTHAASSPTARRRAVNRVVTEVAHYLGNTPAVCRASYIDPRLFERYDEGKTILSTVLGLDGEVADGNLATHGAVEIAVLDLIRDGVQETRRAG